MGDHDRFIRGLPKAELHVHIEGTLEPALFFALAERNGIAIPYASEDELRAAYRFADLQEFLDLYYRGMDVLRREEDFHDLTTAYLRAAAAAGVRHAEIFFDPQAHTRRGIPFETVLDGIESALHAGRRDLSLSTSLILCFLRDLGPQDALQTFATARPHLVRLTGVGLDSAEVGHPAAPFAGVFAQARAEGLHAVAHAGEEGPPAYIWQALDDLGAERIDHGIRAIEDEALVARLAREAIPLTVCPLSNVCLRTVERIENHPLPQLIGRGLTVTINSDDPAYFGGQIDANFRAVATAFALDRADLSALARNSFRAAFVDEARRTAWLDEVDAYEAGFDPA